MRPDLNSQGSSSINHVVWNWSQFFASQSTMTATQIGWTEKLQSSRTAATSLVSKHHIQSLECRWAKRDRNTMPEEDWTTFYNTTKRAQIKLGMASRQIQGLWRKRQRLCGKDETFLGHFEIKLGKDIFRIDTLFQIWLKFCQNLIFGL